MSEEKSSRKLKVGIGSISKMVSRTLGLSKKKSQQNDKFSETDSKNDVSAIDFDESIPIFDSKHVGKVSTDATEVENLLLNVAEMNHTSTNIYLKEDSSIFKSSIEHEDVKSSRLAKSNESSIDHRYLDSINANSPTSTSTAVDANGIPRTSPINHRSSGKSSRYNLSPTHSTKSSEDDGNAIVRECNMPLRIDKSQLSNDYNNAMEAKRQEKKIKRRATNNVDGDAIRDIIVDTETNVRPSLVKSSSNSLAEDSHHHPSSHKVESAQQVTQTLPSLISSMLIEDSSSYSETTNHSASLLESNEEKILMPPKTLQPLTSPSTTSNVYTSTSQSSRPLSSQFSRSASEGVSTTDIRVTMPNPQISSLDTSTTNRDMLNMLACTPRDITTEYLRETLLSMQVNCGLHENINKF